MCPGNRAGTRHGCCASRVRELYRALPVAWKRADRKAWSSSTLVRGLGRDVDQHVRPQVEGLDSHLRDQAVHLVREGLVGVFLENGCQVGTRAQPNIAWSLAANHKPVPKRFFLQFWLLGGERRFERLVCSRAQLHRCVIGPKSGSGHTIAPREGWQEL